ncbi:MAG: hypothetical protein KAJ07_03205 [Planctomycetes bacterium]|nr:hypothetical protein [Planctomycetota bacterium]
MSQRCRFGELFDGSDPKAGQLWRFSGAYVDNTDVFTVMKDAITAQ